MPPEAVGDVCFRQFFFRYNFRPEVNSEVISSVAIDHFCVDVRVKFDLVIVGKMVFEIFEELISRRTNEQDQAYLNSAKHLTSVHRIGSI